MEATAMIKCHSCEDHYEEDEVYTHDKDGNPYCESCEQSIWQNPITITRSFQGETTKVYYSPELGITMDTEYGEYDHTSPDCIDDTTWVSYGHRGHTDITPASGYEAVLTGWVTGLFDDVSYKHAINYFTKELYEGDIFPPCPVYIVIAPTSNVFSMGCDIIIPEAHVEEFKEWINEETGYTFDQLDQALR